MWICTTCQHENLDSVDICEECRQPKDTTEVDLVGRSIGHWKIEQQLGEGGMAVVYLARHETLGSLAAIKLLRQEITHKKDVIGRFRTEARAASHLRHDNIIDVLDFGYEEDLGFYMILEFLEGEDLEEALDNLNGQPMPLDLTLHIAKQVADGLGAAHEAGIIHRDLKPSNIFLVPDKNSTFPKVKILDFGIAKITESEFENEDQHLTRTGTILGTPYYLSPEQLTSRKSKLLTPSVDIYAFGVILYQMCTGALPIEEPSVAEQMVAILTKKPPLAGEINPQLAGTALELFLHRMLSKNPKDRPATIQEAWLELEKATGVIGDEEKNKNLRQEWESTYRPFDAEQTFFQQWKWGILVVVLLALIAGGLAIYKLLTTKPKEKVIIVKERAVIPEIRRLQAEGISAFDKGDYNKAIALWKKAIHSKDWKRGSKHYNPEIYKSLGVAMIRKKWLYAAIKQYQNYLEAASLTPEQRKRMNSLVAELKKKLSLRKKFAAELHKKFEIAFKQGHHGIAHKLFSSLFTIDSSMPEPYLNAAETLEPKYPLYALSLYKKALQLPMSPLAKKALQRKIHQLERQQNLDKQKLLTQLNEALAEKKIARSQKIMRQLIRHHAEDKDVFLSIKKIIQQYFLSEPRISKRLLYTFRREIQQLQRSSSKIWLKDVLAFSSPMIEELQQLAKQASLVKRLFKQDERVEKYLKKGHLKYALKLYRKLLPQWEKLKEAKTPWQEEIKKRLTLTKRRIALIEKSLPLWQETLKFIKEARFPSALEPYKQFIELIKGTGAEKKYQRLFARWERRYKRSQKYLRRGHKFYMRHHWLQAEQYYIRYLKLFPKAWQRKHLKKRIDICQCNRGVPWKECPKRKIRLP